MTRPPTFIRGKLSTSCLENVWYNILMIKIAKLEIVSY